MSMHPHLRRVSNTDFALYQAVELDNAGRLTDGCFEKLFKDIDGRELAELLGRLLSIYPELVEEIIRARE